MSILDVVNATSRSVNEKTKNMQEVVKADAAEEMERIQKAEEIREEIEPKEEVTQKIFKVV